MAEGVGDSQVVCVKVAVVEVDAFAKVAIRGIADINWVVGGRLGKGVGQFARGVDVAIENIGDGIAGLFAQKAGVEDPIRRKRQVSMTGVFAMCSRVDLRSNVLVVSPSANDTRTSDVGDHNGVVAVVSNSVDHIILV